MNKLRRQRLEPSLTLASRPITKSDVPGDVIVKTGKTPKRWRIEVIFKENVSEAA
jgi:hypothetical protein